MPLHEMLVARAGTFRCTRRARPLADALAREARDETHIPRLALLRGLALERRLLAARSLRHGGDVRHMEHTHLCTASAVHGCVRRIARHVTM